MSVFLRDYNQILYNSVIISLYVYVQFAVLENYYKTYHKKCEDSKHHYAVNIIL